MLDIKGKIVNPRSDRKVTELSTEKKKENPKKQRKSQRENELIWCK